MFGGHASGEPDAEAIRRELEKREGEFQEERDVADAADVAPTLANQMCIVISFNIPTDSPEASHARTREILQKVKGELADQDGVLVWGAVNETAAAIVKVLNEGVEEQEGEV
jgi:hypothetical protein